jgi:hypothetical protein
MKATHYGTCQICNSLQKAPGGFLAKHGYDVQYGFFNGICRGSHELPYEVSNELLVAILASIKVSIANYVEVPKPERTTPGRNQQGYSRAKAERSAQWVADERAESGWAAAREQHSANQRFVPFAEARIAAWAPAALIPVETVEAREQAVKGARKGIQALSKAKDAAKRALVKHGEHFAGVVDEVLNGGLYADRRAFWDACRAKNDFTSIWPKSNLLVEIPCFATNRVAKLVKLAQASNNADLIEGAAKLEQLADAYESAKSAHEDAKA